MPLTPETWLDAQTVDTDANSRPEVVQLASGHILVAWTGDLDQPGSPGDNIIGRIYDPLGNPLTDEIRLSTSAATDAQDVSFAALPNGGFVMAYEDNGTDNDLRFTTYDYDSSSADLSFVRSGFIVNDAVDGAVPNSLSIAATSNTSAGVAWRVNNTDGSEDVIFNTFNPQTGVFETPQTILDSDPGQNASSPQVAALDNGNYVIMYVNKNPGPDDLNWRIQDSNNGFVDFGTVAPAGGTEFTGVDVTALSGGRWAAAWRIENSDFDIVTNVFEADGSNILSPAAVSASGDNANELTISSLADGGYVVMYDNETDSTIEGRRFDSDRSSVGNRFTVNSGNVEGAPEVIGLADGRFLTTWDDAATIEMQIFDTRDDPNATAIYTPDDYQIGTVGDDVFTAAGAIFSTVGFVHGWDGNDIITDGDGTQSLISGDDGDDQINMINISSNEDAAGGDGIDLITFTSLGNGDLIDLLAETATGGTQTMNLTGFENFSYNGPADVIVIGNASDNILEGGTGDDTLAGYDLSIGGLIPVSHNTLLGRGGDDELNGHFGEDSIDGGSGNDLLIGGGEDDTMFGGSGNDTLVGGSDSDSLNGGSGIDTVDYDGSSGAVTIDLAAQTASGGHAQGDTLVSIENAIGSGLSDTLTGDDGVNFLDGGGQDDLLRGGAGSDTLAGSAGDDSIDGGSDNDSIDGNVGDDTITGGGTTDTLAGNNGDDFIDGESGSDRILGGPGGDSMFGSAGNDFLAGNAGIDIISGGNGADDIVGGAGADRADGDGGSDTIVGNAGDDTLDGGSGADDILGQANADFILGGSGNDTLGGNGAGDTIEGGFGSDTIRGNAGDDIVYGDAGEDRLLGGNGSDTISGGTSEDRMSGGAGADSFVFDDGETGTNVAGADVITDFSRTEGDLIDLSDVDAIAGGGDSAFTFIGTAAFSGSAGQLRYETSGGETRVFGDTDGDGSADFALRLLDTTNLIASDFVL